jgi:hypothetical protein
VSNQVSHPYKKGKLYIACTLKVKVATSNYWDKDVSECHLSTSRVNHSPIWKYIKIIKAHFLRELAQNSSATAVPLAVTMV